MENCKRHSLRGREHQALQNPGKIQELGSCCPGSKEPPDGLAANPRQGVDFRVTARASRGDQDHRPHGR